MTDKADSGGFQRTPPESPLENPAGNPPASAEGNDARNRQAPNPAAYPAPGGPGQDQPGRDYLGGFLFERPGGRDGPAGKEAKESPPEGAAEGSLEDRVVEALRAIYDPEIPVNIYDLGLIYGVAVDADAHVVVTMTLTTPHCPVAEIMPAEVEQKTSAVAGVSGATVNLVWDPPWDPSCMSEEAQLELGFI